MKTFLVIMAVLLLGSIALTQNESIAADKRFVISYGFSSAPPVFDYSGMTLDMVETGKTACRNLNGMLVYYNLRGFFCVKVDVDGIVQTDIIRRGYIHINIQTADVLCRIYGSELYQLSTNQNIHTCRKEGIIEGERLHTT